MVRDSNPRFNLDNGPALSQVAEQLGGVEVWPQGLPRGALQPAQQMRAVLQACWYQLHWHEIYGDLQRMP